MVAEAPGWPQVPAFHMTWPPGPYSTRLPSPCMTSWYWPFGEEMDWLAVRTRAAGDDSEPETSSGTMAALRILRLPVIWVLSSVTVSPSFLRPPPKPLPTDLLV